MQCLLVLCMWICSLGLAAAASNLNNYIGLIPTYKPVLLHIPSPAGIRLDRYEDYNAVALLALQFLL